MSSFSVTDGVRTSDVQWLDGVRLNRLVSPFNGKADHRGSEQQWRLLQRCPCPKPRVEQIAGCRDTVAHHGDRVICQEWRPVVEE